MNRELIEREIKMLGSVQEGFDNSATNQHTKVADRKDHKKKLFLSNFFQAQFVSHLEDLIKSVREAGKKSK